MKFDEIYEKLKDVPFMTHRQAHLIYNFVLSNHPKNVLELGTAHGKSSLIMAAALQELSSNTKITTIDNLSALELKPNINQLSEKLGLGKYITPIFAQSTYNWELMKLIQSNTRQNVCEPIYDFCYMDGAHNFEIDTAAFFLVDKLLCEGGVILFDDLNWTYSESEGLKNTDFVKKMSRDEANTPHIKKLFEFVVMQHPSYSDFKVQDEWAWARKVSSNRAESFDYNLIYKETTIKSDFVKLLRKIKNQVLR